MGMVLSAFAIGVAATAIATPFIIQWFNDKEAEDKRLSDLGIGKHKDKKIPVIFPCCKRTGFGPIYQHFNAPTDQDNLFVYNGLFDVYPELVELWDVFRADFREKPPVDQLFVMPIIILRLKALEVYEVFLARAIVNAWSCQGDVARSRYQTYKKTGFGVIWSTNRSEFQSDKGLSSKLGFAKISDNLVNFYKDDPSILAVERNVTALQVANKIDTVCNLFIVGPTRAGKTSIAQHLASARPVSGDASATLGFVYSNYDLGSYHGSVWDSMGYFDNRIHPALADYYTMSWLRSHGPNVMSTITIVLVLRDYPDEEQSHEILVRFQHFEFELYSAVLVWNGDEPLIKNKLYSSLQHCGQYVELGAPHLIQSGDVLTLLEQTMGFSQKWIYCPPEDPWSSDLLVLRKQSWVEEVTNEIEYIAHDLSIDINGQVVERFVNLNQGTNHIFTPSIMDQIRIKRSLVINEQLTYIKPKGFVSRAKFWGHNDSSRSQLDKNSSQPDRSLPKPVRPLNRVGIVGLYVSHHEEALSAPFPLNVLKFEALSQQYARMTQGEKNVVVPPVDFDRGHYKISEDSWEAIKHGEAPNQVLLKTLAALSTSDYFGKKISEYAKSLMKVENLTTGDDSHKDNEESEDLHVLGSRFKPHPDGEGINNPFKPKEHDTGYCPIRFCYNYPKWDAQHTDIAMLCTYHQDMPSVQLAFRDFEESVDKPLPYHGFSSIPENAVYDGRPLAKRIFYATNVGQLCHYTHKNSDNPHVKAFWVKELTSFAKKYRFKGYWNKRDQAPPIEVDFILAKPGDVSDDEYGTPQSSDDE